ncbi:universal stress protein [Reyranella sp.]|uniref:universal stress protein n=1 Tax=Reyranella sp. TaxID=1929291 RepID=UPI003C7C3AE3
MTNAAAASAPSKVLVATDLSARSDRAVERAVLLAKVTGSALTILHVVDAELPRRTADRLVDEARELIGEHVAALKGAEAMAPDIKVVLGTDYKEIEDVALKSGCELIVLGVHRNETRDLFRGTTAERVIRSRACQVLMVKARPQSDYRRIMVAVDFSDCSRRAIEFAVKLFPNAEFHLVHAFDVPFKAFLRSEDTRQEVSRSHEEEMERFVNGDFPALLPLLQAVPARVFPVQKQGPVRDVIEDQVDQLKPDLLVLGTHGRSGIAHAVMGSVAEDLLSYPPCDILAVRP